jgi:hypothetical protein
MTPTATPSRTGRDAVRAGQPFTVPDLRDDADARTACGFNLSAIRQDVMLGGPAVAVDGLDPAGNATHHL